VRRLRWFAVWVLARVYLLALLWTRLGRSFRVWLAALVTQVQRCSADFGQVQVMSFAPAWLWSFLPNAHSRQTGPRAHPLTPYPRRHPNTIAALREGFASGPCAVELFQLVVFLLLINRFRFNRDLDSDLCLTVLSAFVNVPEAPAKYVMTQEAFRLHQFLLENAKTQANSVALVDEMGRETTFAEWLAQVEAMRDALMRVGLRPGDRLMIIAENTPVLTVLLLAGWMMDAWVMPVNARLSSGEIDHLLDHADPRIVVLTTEVFDSALTHAKRLSADKLACEFNLEFVGRPGAKAEPVCAAAEDQVAALMYTTGTTGNPKGVMLSHANLAWYAKTSRDVRHMTPNDRTFCVLPLTHIYGLASAFLGSLCAGSCLHTVPRFDPATVFSALQDGATVMPAVPPMYAQLLDHAAAQGWETLPDVPLRHIMTGGAPLDPDWKRRVEHFFKLPLHNGYGMTECSPGISTTQNAVLSEAAAEDVSCGHILPKLEVKIVPPPGETDLNEGVGEIVVRGPNVMLGYYKNATATDEVMDADDYFHTGDLGYFDEDQRLFLSGRSKELIIRSGFNIYPPEVEAELSRHPAVTMAAVVGRPIKGNEEVIAFVQPVPGKTVTEAELHTFLRDYLVAYKCPSHIIIDAALPASSTGKLLKSKMLETYQASLPAV